MLHSSMINLVQSQVATGQMIECVKVLAKQSDNVILALSGKTHLIV